MYTHTSIYVYSGFSTLRVCVASLCLVQMSVFMCVYVYIYIHIYIYVYVYAHIHTYMYI